MSGAIFGAMVVVAVVAGLALAAPLRAGDNPSPTYSYARIVRLSYVNGDVQIVRTDKSKNWEPAVMNMPVEQGFAIGTNEGRAEVEFEHGSMLWLAPNSMVQFTELALSNGGRITRMTLSEGVATFQTSLSAGDTFEVTTPSMTVTATKKAEFRVGVREKDSAVNMRNGEVSVASEGKTQEVAKGQMFICEPRKKQQFALVHSPAPDEWDRWVNSRLSTEVATENQTALGANAPFTYGMADLADYGSWSYFPGYGYGWQPFGMNTGWAPFMDGQWMFYPTFGWTWVSGEPWGWVPYHFGGWEYSPAFGWMWMPGDFGAWTAAPVQWYTFGKRVGWTPRGVSGLRAGTVPTPVIVSSKTLGKEGGNHLLSGAQISAAIQSQKMRSMDVSPAENGKSWAIATERTDMAHVVVPTAGNLTALSARLTANAGARVSVNSVHEAPTSRAMIERSPRAGFTAVNAAMAAPRISSRPPTRAAFISPEMSASHGYNGYGSSPAISAPSQTSPARASMPAETSHAAASSPGRPR